MKLLTIQLALLVANVYAGLQPGEHAFNWFVVGFALFGAMTRTAELLHATPATDPES